MEGTSLGRKSKGKRLKRGKGGNIRKGEARNVE
jgi:hypothetical protein